MKKRNNDRGLNRHTRFKDFLILSFRSYGAILCFMLLPLPLLTFMTGVTSANSIVKNDQTLPQTILTDPNGLQRHELIRADISVPKSQEDGTSKDKLRQLIEQIRSIQFGSEIPAPESHIISKKAQVIEPNKTPSDERIERQEEIKVLASDLHCQQITDQTLRMLKILLQHPDDLDNPFELGEVLFLSQNVKESALFYQEALKRTDPNNMDSSQDRAWILLQIGNCLRDHDYLTAKIIYGQLLTEYPASPWSDLAKVQRQLIDWYLRDEPRKLIAEVKNARSR